MYQNIYIDKPKQGKPIVHIWDDVKGYEKFQFTPYAYMKSTTGTYISNKYPDLLLYACLVNAYGYLKGPQDMLQYYKAAYKEALESYAIEQIGQRRRSEYGDGVIRAQIISKSPSSN